MAKRYQWEVGQRVIVYHGNRREIQAVDEVTSKGYARVPVRTFHGIRTFEFNTLGRFSDGYFGERTIVPATDDAVAQLERENRLRRLRHAVTQFRWDKATDDQIEAVAKALGLEVPHE